MLTRQITLLAQNHYHQQEKEMFNWAFIFLVVAIVAAVLGFSGIAGAATNIAWILFVVGLIVAAVFFIRGRSSV